MKLHPQPEKGRSSMEQRENAVLELIRKSNDPEAALKAALVLLMSLQEERGNAPVCPLAVS